jgi:hypothetical protein
MIVANVCMQVSFNLPDTPHEAAEAHQQKAAAVHGPASFRFHSVSPCKVCLRLSALN